MSAAGGGNEKEGCGDICWCVDVFLRLGCCFVMPFALGSRCCFGLASVVILGGACPSGSLGVKSDMLIGFIFRLPEEVFDST